MGGDITSRSGDEDTLFWHPSAAPLSLAPFDTATHLDVRLMPDIYLSFPLLGHDMNFIGPEECKATKFPQTASTYNYAQPKAPGWSRRL